MLRKEEKMYHIKNDKRAYKSAILISESLADMLKEKKYDEISITDVCVARGVARTTFYRLFDTLDDVLIYQFDTLFEESIKQFTSVTNMGKSFARFMVEIAMNNRALVTAIVESGRSDLFDFSTRAKEPVIIQSMKIVVDDKDRLYCTPMLTQLAYAVFRTWISTGCRETADELYGIMKQELKLIYENM